MSFIKNFKKFIVDLYLNGRDEFIKSKKKLFFLEDNNLSVAFNFFEIGDFSECINRLKIMNKLWPDNEDARYLLGVSYILSRDCDKAIKILKDLKDFKNEYVSKLIFLASENKSKMVIDAYIEGNFSLRGIEDELKRIDI